MGGSPASMTMTPAPHDDRHPGSSPDGGGVITSIIDTVFKTPRAFDGRISPSGVLMLTQHFPFLDPERLTVDFAERLRTLAQDCAGLARDPAFARERLRTAPQLDRYVPLVTPIGLHLVGQLTDDPRPDAGPIVTSQLWLADPEGSWVRTLTQLYRLGRPADPHGRDRIMTAALMVCDGRDGDDGGPLASPAERRPT
jgi:hypothetical protein